MAATTPPAPVKLFVVTLHQNPADLEPVMQLLRKEWGDTDYQSEDFPFLETNYYESEMGANLSRRFYSFKRLIDPGQIVEAKLYSNEIEEKFLNEKGRKVNLDPGYLDTYKVVLASAKFGGQKIYLRNGIYADMTLNMYKGKWEAFLWGFPDFKSRKYDDVLCKIRDLYKQQRRNIFETTDEHR